MRSTKIQFNMNMWGISESTILRQWEYANTSVHVFEVLEKEFVLFAVFHSVALEWSNRYREERYFGMPTTFEKQYPENFPNAQPTLNREKKPSATNGC